MEEKNWLDYLVALATVSTPILIAILTVVGWKYRQSMEHKFKIEEKLRDDRIEIYNQILEPFIILLMTDEAWLSDPKNKNKDKNTVGKSKLLSLEHRKVSSKLSLIGSDAVVKSFNDLMQYTFHMAKNTSKNSLDSAKEVMSLLGTLLLEIRKSMGNEATKINSWGMLEWFITDARKYRDDESPK